MPAPEPQDAVTEPEQIRTERLGLAVTPDEMSALEKIATLWPQRYAGTSSVLRDYTPRQAVEFVQRLTDTLVATP